MMGPSGSGKSTLLQILGCLDRPTRGSYFLNQQEVSTLSEDQLSTIRREEIGFVFQSFHLVPRLSAAENVALPMVLAGIPRAERKKRVEQALDSVGLAQRAAHRPSELSGGEMQRIAIARATVMKPKILLADEPTGNLDSRSGKQIIELIENLNQAGLTLFVVTHDPAVARRAKQILIMTDGQIVRQMAGHELEVGVYPFQQEKVDDAAQ